MIEIATLIGVVSVKSFSNLSVQKENAREHRDPKAKNAAKIPTNAGGVRLSRRGQPR